MLLHACHHLHYFENAEEASYTSCVTFFMLILPGFNLLYNLHNCVYFDFYFSTITDCLYSLFTML